MTAVASTVPARVGKPSDPEDLQAARTREPVVLQEGHNLDYSVASEERSGRTVVIGVTVSGATGASRDALLERARQIADETAAAIRASG